MQSIFVDGFFSFKSLFLLDLLPTEVDWYGSSGLLGKKPALSVLPED